MFCGILVRFRHYTAMTEKLWLLVGWLNISINKNWGQRVT